MQLILGNGHLTDNPMSRSKRLSQASATYAAEQHFEAEMPSRVFTLNDAQFWLDDVCEIEDIDPINISQQKLPSRIAAAAMLDDWSIVVPNKTVSQHTLLHELAHFLCANLNHGHEFRTQLVALHRRHTSLPHAVCLQQIFVASKLTVSMTLPL